MKKTVASIFALALSVGFLQAQDTMYVMKSDSVVYQRAINEIDSVIFYSPTTSSNPLNLTLVNIPAGTFTMGSPSGETGCMLDETQYQVTLSAFRMSKSEITNTEYAAFLNAKSIGSNGLYAAGAFPTEALIYSSASPYDFGLHYTAGQWVPVVGYETHPVIFVTWYGSTEFATYAGGTLATEAQWEYACRGNTTTPFNTGACLSDAQANYYWADPYNTCTNTNTSFPATTQTVGSYTANAYGLQDMHGNVWEWCSDWYGTYPTAAQTNPTGASTGSNRLIRGGGWNNAATACRSAYRDDGTPTYYFYNLGFRIVLLQDLNAIASVDKQGAIQLYPNPVADVLNIQLPNEGNQECIIELLAIDGRLVCKEKQNPHENVIQVNVSLLAQGIYFCKVTKGTTTTTTKFIKQ